MKEADLKQKVWGCLSACARGGLRASLFTDTPEEDAEALLEAFGTAVPQSQHVAVVRLVGEWRTEHAWLAGIPDKDELLQDYVTVGAD